MYILAETMAQDDHALEHQDHVRRNPRGALGHVRSHQQEAEEHRRRHDACGMQGPEQGHHDSGETVPRGDVLDGAVVDARDLHGPRDPRETPGEDHGHHQRPRYIDSCVAGGLGLGPGRPQAESESGVPEEEIDANAQDEGQDQPGVQPGPGDEVAQQAVSGRRMDWGVPDPVSSSPGSIMGPRRRKV